MTDHVEVFDGYDAEVIRLLAEKSGKSPEDIVLSFFDTRCNALGPKSSRASA